ncbi:Ku protein [Streptomyces sp. NPDC052236]|uniref:Ku protein n=1 Tax=Streptomyces sp. NPDC052236 TaxID=3365686 RepID=UPI0037D659B3
MAAHGAVAARPYSLIVKALQRNAKAAIARYSLRDRERLGLLRVKDGVLVLHQLLAADEIRSPSVVAPPQGSVPDDELQSALELTDALTADDLSGLTDHYTEALEEVIHAKLEGKRPAPATQGQAPQAPVFDLMAALNESVKAARAARGETGEHATVHEMPRKRVAKKTTAATQKPAPATKQPTGKKSTGRRKPHKGA